MLPAKRISLASERMRGVGSYCLGGCQGFDSPLINRTLFVG
jgi:hypothetical protein